MPSYSIIPYTLNDLNDRVLIYPPRTGRHLFFGLLINKSFNTTEHNSNYLT